MSQNKLVNLEARLEQIDIHGFRSCVNTRFLPNNDLSALIGINGSGKTNILQALRMLKFNGNQVGFRYTGNESRGTEAILAAWFRVGDLRVGLRLKLNVLDSPRYGDEFVSNSEEWNIECITGLNEWIELPPHELFMRRRGYFSTKKEEAAFFAEMERRYAIRSSLKQPRKFSTEDPQIKACLYAIAGFREGIAYYSASQFTDPTKCPSSFEVDEDERLVESYTISKNLHVKYLYDLYRLKINNPTIYNEYCKLISKKQLGLISRVLWKEVELSSNVAEVKSGGRVSKVKKTKILLIPKLQVGRNFITFNQLSEGTFKTLALIFYIMTDASSLLMVEEPEVCVHHGLLSKITAALTSYSGVKQTVISTHSDLLVDNLPPEKIFVVEMTNAGTRVSNLKEWLTPDGKAALHQYLEESGTLGEYWKSGGLVQ